MTQPDAIDTVFALIAKQAAIAPDAVALIDEDGARLSYGALADQVALLADDLAGAADSPLGTRPRIGIVLPNGPDLSVALLAATIAGEATPFNPGLTSAEFERYFAATKIDILLVDADDTGAAAVAGAIGLPVLRLSSARRILGVGAGGAVPRAAQPQASDIAMVLMTSGSTGMPKIVPLSHGNVCASAADVAGSVALTAADRCLVMWQQFHIGGLVDLLLAPLSVGSALIVTPGFNEAKFFALTEQLQPTWFQGVPTTLGALAQYAERHGLDPRGTSLRFIRSVAAALTENGSGAGESKFPSLDISDEDSDEDSDDDISDMQSIPVARRTRRRTAISAAPFNMAQVKSEEAKVFEKAPAIAAGIRAILAKNILFQHLDADQLQTVINAFMPMEFEDGSDIITQGETGEHFFLLATGEADVFVSKRGAEPVKVLTYGNGSGAAFGELALMYNAPRAATVRAKGAVKVWALDQPVFKQIVVGSAARRYDQQIEFLRNVKVLATLSEGERREVASALKRVSFNTGQVVVRQGDRGDDFYIVESGELLCTAQKSPDEAPEELLRLGPADYFGEIALLTNRPRQATVMVLKPTICLTVDRATFKRVLGPLKKILKRNMGSYQKFVTEHL